MGSAASVEQQVQGLSPVVFQILDHDLKFGALHSERTSSQLNLSDTDLFDRIQLVIAGATKEAELPLAECRCPAVVLFKHSQLSEDEKEEFSKAILEAAIAKDQATTSQHKAVDYSQTFGGTEADHNKEKDAAEILRGEPAASDAGILTQPDMVHPSEHEALKAAGKWKKFLSASGCYLYVNSLTRDTVAVRPDDFEDDAADQASQQQSSSGEPVDPANGLPSVLLTELPAMVDHIVNELHKTPLILDTSESQVARTFYSYKANLADASALTIPYGKSGVKKEDIMDRCRHVLVNSMKKGQLFALYLGTTSIEHADIKGKLCKKDCFPKETFIKSGRALLEPDYDPRYKHIYREEDLESGQAIAR